MELNYTIFDIKPLVNIEDDNGEFLIGKDKRDEIVGFLGNLYNSVSFQKVGEDKYLVKYSNKRK